VQQLRRLVRFEEEKKVRPNSRVPNLRQLSFMDPFYEQKNFKSMRKIGEKSQEKSLLV